EGVSPGAYPAGADQEAERYYYIYQSILYGLQGGGGGYVTPEMQAQVARSVQQYFTNGAAMTAVPTTGAAAAYFTNGAQATAAPTSAMSDYSFSPPLAAPPSLAFDAGAPPRVAVAPVEAGAAQAEAPAPVPTGTEVAAEPAYAPEPAYPEGTATAAPATPRVPASPTAVPAPTPATAPPAPAPAPNCAVDAYGRCIPEAAPAPAPSPSPAARIAPSAIVLPMLGGIAIGALLVLLGTRIRPRSPSST
ncbi:MAG TPA: hypothetical protein VK762_08225, partial [Polyangiaceae bacterium]|nr:hypothetical protein [Polyangiaceae bacterium]